MLLAPGAARAAQPYPVSYHAFPLPRGGITLPKTGLTTITYADPYGYAPRDYQSAAWMSPWLETGFGFTELVSSWNADTPQGTWLQVEMHATALDAHETKWYVLGR